MGQPIPTYDEIGRQRLIDAYQVAKKLFHLLAEETATTNEGMLVVAQLTAQLLLNLSNGDKEEAIAALHYEFLSLTESMVEAINVNKPVDVPRQS
jgi:hypothetical protein